MLSRRTALTLGSISLMASTPAATVFFVPPASWMVNVRKVSLSLIPVCSMKALIWNPSQPRPTMTTPPMFGFAA